MSSDMQTQIDRLCVLGDVHVMERTGWTSEGEELRAFSARIGFARQNSANLFFSGDLWDRSVVRQMARTGKLPDACKRVVDVLSDFKSQTGKLIFHVDGNHDPHELVQDALPDGLIGHQGIIMQIPQNHGEEGKGILVLHGHVLTQYFRCALKQILETDPENPADACDALLHNRRVIKASRNVLTDVIAPPVFSMLHRIDWGDPAERFVFDRIERRRDKYRERYAKLMARNKKIPFPSAKDTVGLMAKLRGALGCRLGVLGHTHRHFCEKRSDVIIVNGGGGLRSDPRPRYFLDIDSDTMALHAVDQYGDVKEGNRVQWAA